MTYEEIFLLAFLQRGLRNYRTEIAVGASLPVRVRIRLWSSDESVLPSHRQAVPVVFAHVLADVAPFVV